MCTVCTALCALHTDFKQLYNLLSCHLNITFSLSSDFHFVFFLFYILVVHFFFALSSASGCAFQMRNKGKHTHISSRRKQKIKQKTMQHTNNREKQINESTNLEAMQLKMTLIAYFAYYFVPFFPLFPPINSSFVCDFR